MGTLDQIRAELAMLATIAGLARLWEVNEPFTLELQTGLTNRWCQLRDELRRLH
jgi:hypothetical protein